jgi:hypothetical protein
MGYLYNTDNLALLYYSDSVSHLVRARQLLDYSSPGVGQVGTAWLPLPHFALLPFSLVDLLFRTGLAGTIVSLPSIAISSVFLYNLIKRQTKISWIAVMGACLYFLNPNVLYLGITAMTESLFMLFFIVAAYYFQRTVTSEMYSTIKDDNNISSINLKDHIDIKDHNNISSINLKDHIDCLCAPNRTQGPKHKFHVSDNLLKCSFFISLATLCRYEAWPIPVVLTLFIILRYLETNALDKGLEVRLSNQKRLMCGLVCITLSFSGIILWISYNTIYFNSPFEFFFSPYYSAAAQALDGQN